jgi:hypothetical protein
MSRAPRQWQARAMRKWQRNRRRGGGDPFTAPPGSMPLLSRHVPATASSGKAAGPRIDVRRVPPDHVELWNCWIAYDPLRYRSRSARPSW